MEKCLHLQNWTVRKMPRNEMAWIVNSRTQSIRIPHRKNPSNPQSVKSIKGPPANLAEAQLWQQCGKHSKNFAGSNTLFTQTRTKLHDIRDLLALGLSQIEYLQAEQSARGDCPIQYLICVGNASTLNRNTERYICKAMCCVPCLALLRQTQVSVWS